MRVRNKRDVRTDHARVALIGDRICPTPPAPLIFSAVWTRNDVDPGVRGA